MKKNFLIQYPTLFQGENILKKEKTYFEGWYFKHTSPENRIAFIPGICIEKGKKSAFIQVITDYDAYYIPFDFSDFHFSHVPFFIEIGDNYFSLEQIRIHIHYHNVTIQGQATYQERQTIQKTVLSPNIMGPFSYLPFMECHHALLSMKHLVDGSFTLNESTYIFEKDIGYIEKDWGTSFPKSYIWTQGNHFVRPSTSFFASIAHIPIGPTAFQGFICVLILNGKEYRFTTYNGSKISNLVKSQNDIAFTFQKEDLKLQVFSQNADSFPLLAPKCGQMNTPIQESLNANVHLILSQKEKILYEDTSSSCGLEIV
ncbi:MAG: tocopherol cyclase family protein [Clostridia bacterium]